MSHADFTVKRHWWNRERNWLNETPKAEHERRITALEEHINSLEVRYSELENRLNVIASHTPIPSRVQVQLPTLKTGSKTTDAS